MEVTTRPLFTVYAVWHSSYAKGDKISELLRRRFGNYAYCNVAGGLGVSVIYRNKPVPNSHTPLPIDWDEAETTAVIVLVDSVLASDSAWSNYFFELSRNAQTRGFLTRLFPVIMEAGGLELRLEEQALRWDQLGESEIEREQQFVSHLTYEFSRMLRHRLDLLRRPEGSNASFSHYLEKIQVFISHSKHDNDGEVVARSIRNWLHDNIALSSFFDVFDIPAGLSFREVLLHQIETSAVVLVHTDSYSSREWCRREVIEAKRRHVPMIIVDCLRDIDQRAIPYMGNVPIVRVDVDRQDRINRAIRSLLDEVFRTYLWRCRVEPFRATHAHVLFTARPPELISLATLPEYESNVSSAIVYPEPPLGTDEARLFSEIAPNVLTRTLTEWLAEIQ